MKSTDWRKLPDEWKTNLMVSLRFQEEQTDSNTIQKAFAQKANTSPLEAYVSIFGDEISAPLWPDTMFLHNLLQLRRIYLQNADIDTLFPLMYFPLLEELYISHTPIDSLESLMLNNSIRVLHIDHTYIDELMPLSSMQLEEFSAKDTDISELAPLRNQHTLKKLDLRETSIDSLMMLYELSNLEELYISQETVSQQEINAFRKSHPDCKLIIED
ncbi:hypothetical protein V6R21_11425 [Limibacter armeniacum]|uniref:hypothetical protein n=1 Tax=Limibacter armeniacum TaxID=466084 RepID=UPI002FE5AE3E